MSLTVTDDFFKNASVAINVYESSSATKPAMYDNTNNQGGFQKFSMSDFMSQGVPENRTSNFICPDGVY